MEVKVGYGGTRKTVWQDEESKDQGGEAMLQSVEEREMRRTRQGRLEVDD